MSREVLVGDCIERMAEMEEASIDAIVCDPPYGLEFMGKEWDRLGEVKRAKRGAIHNMVTRDGSQKFKNEMPAFDLGASANRRMQEWHQAWATEALRVLKPGAHLLAFGGTRTYHRLACALEDAGFEIRDSLLWLYGSGFPKSLDVSKAIDKAVGVEGEWRQEDHPGRAGARVREDPSGARIGQTFHDTNPENPEGLRHVYEPGSEEAQRWAGWGTALKPSHEPIVVTQKPRSGTVAANVMEHGTGALNIDGCRVGFVSEEDERESKDKNQHADFGTEPGGNAVYGDYSMVPSKNYDASGRWPANVVLSEEAAAEIDRQSGERPGNFATRGESRDGQIFGYGNDRGEEPRGYGDTGGASRFFYCAKVGVNERNAGLEDFEGQFAPTMGNGIGGKEHDPETATRKRNTHPTVKPINLMRWLCRLVTPGGGLIVDPFAGSGTTGCAAALEGFQFIGIEREAEYAEIARARIAFWEQHVGREVEEVLSSVGSSIRETRRHEEAGQMGLEI